MSYGTIKGRKNASKGLASRLQHKKVKYV